MNSHNGHQDEHLGDASSTSTSTDSDEIPAPPGPIVVATHHNDDFPDEQETIVPSFPISAATTSAVVEQNHDLDQYSTDESSDDEVPSIPEVCFNVEDFSYEFDIHRCVCLQYIFNGCHDLEPKWCTDT